MSERVKRLTGAGAWALLAAVFFLWRAPGYDFFAGVGDLDHGYQTTLGQQVFRGAIPGVDYFTQYGPAIGWISALSWVTGHVWLAEVLSWCVFLGAGYGLLWWWLGNDAGPGWKAVVLLPAFFFTPFYAKYYFVFFPALFLVVLGDGLAGSPGSERSWRWFWAGVVAGIAGLFRTELGLALTFAGAVYLGWDHVVARRMPRAAGALVLGSGAVFAGYFLVLAVGARNLAAPLVWLDFQSAAILAKASTFSRSEMILHGPVQRAAAGAWAMLVLAACYVGVSLAGTRLRWRGRYPARIWAAGLLGVALLPHGLNNTGVSYALQVGLPACAGFAAWCLQDRRRALPRVYSLLALACFAGLGLSLGHANYGYDHPRASWTEKLSGLYGGGPVTAEVQGLAAAIGNFAGPGEPILIPSIESRFYALTGHPWAGLFPHLAIPFPARWQERGIEELRRRPPAAVVIPSTDRRFRSRFGYVGMNPLVDNFIANNYVVADRRVEGWLVLRLKTPAE